jgi:thiol-disulfide isomerase/thioredoxin
MQLIKSKNMKNVLVIIVTALILTSGCRAKKPVADSAPVLQPGQEITAMTDFSEQSTWLLGYFTRDRLNKTPHCEWYLKGYDEYQPESTVIKNLLQVKPDNLTIKIVMGTWCPDSRREVPRFMKIIDLWKFPVEKITFIGVDNAKVSPVGEYNSLDIQRVPTFIFYKNNIESGRIIENPVTSLEQDIVNILTRE